MIRFVLRPNPNPPLMILLIFSCLFVCLLTLSCLTPACKCPCRSSSFWFLFLDRWFRVPEPRVWAGLLPYVPVHVSHTGSTCP